MKNQQPAPTTLVAEVARFERLAEARENSLVLLALEIPSTIEREGEEWVVKVDEAHRDAAGVELRRAQGEQEGKTAQPAVEDTVPKTKFRPVSLFIAGWVMAGAYYLQIVRGARWMDSGEANSSRMLSRGEWWRAWTALTLHGDLNHLLTNVATGLLFAGFVAARFGGGVGWFLIVTAGALGNAINAWGYRGNDHHSIGASTAVFGALGILVGAELWRRLRLSGRPDLWRIILPIGAGVSLLAYFGVGDKTAQIDYMAHGWGFVMGIILGFAAEARGMAERTPEWGRVLYGAAALGSLAAAWGMALRWGAA